MAAIVNFNYRNLVKGMFILSVIVSDSFLLIFFLQVLLKVQ